MTQQHCYEYDRFVTCQLGMPLYGRVLNYHRVSLMQYDMQQRNAFEQDLKLALMRTAKQVEAIAIKTKILNIDKNKQNISYCIPSTPIRSNIDTSTSKKQCHRKKSIFEIDLAQFIR